MCSSETIITLGQRVKHLADPRVGLDELVESMVAVPEMKAAVVG